MKQLEGNEPLEAAKLSVEGVSKTFRTSQGIVQALDGVSLEVRSGEFVCILGPSGCGKTTLLNIIAGLEMPDGGRVLADGMPVTDAGSDRLVMFQEPALFPWLSVFGNVQFGLRLKPGLSEKDRRETAEFYLRLVGLEKFMHVNIHELSGGMKQRAALARALAPGPAVLLMDEPFSSLDALTREQLYGDLQEIWERRRQTIIFVTHNAREAACLGDRVLLFSPHPGRLMEQFEIRLPRPRDINSVELAGYTMLIRDTLRSHLRAGATEALE